MAHTPVPNYALSDSQSTIDDLLEYDVISDPGRQSLDSSIADLADFSLRVTLHEVLPSAEANSTFETVALTANDVQDHVSKNIRGPGSSTRRRDGRSRSRGPQERERTYRIYVDGVFDVLNVNVIHHLRQAKLSFPSVHLLVGPFTDSQCLTHGITAAVPHIERSEQLRHLRWVDEVVQDAPAIINESFLGRLQIDFVAIEEGASVNPAISRARLSGYDIVKSLGKAIPTRRTRCAVGPSLRLMPTPSALDTLKLEQLTPKPSHTDDDDDSEIPEPKEDF